MVLTYTSDWKRLAINIQAWFFSPTSKNKGVSFLSLSSLFVNSEPFLQFIISIITFY
jgi:hypothetical protein